MKKIITICTIFVLALMIAACGNQNTKVSSDNSGDSKSYPVTIDNFTKSQDAAKWSDKQQVFEKSPKKVLATTRPVAELLLRLGLDDKIVGVSANFGAVDEEVKIQYNNLKIISDTYIGKEITIGMNPDLIIGRGDLFTDGDGRIGTVDSLNSMNIKTYVLNSSVSGATYKTVYQDIDNIGRIFNIQNKSNALKEELKAKEASIREKFTKIDETKTFAYIHTNDPKILKVEAQSQDTFLNDILGMVNLENIFSNDTGDISLETFIKADPDIIIIPKWDEKTDLNAVREEIYKNEQLSNMKAIKNRAIYVVDYNYLYGYSYSSIYGMEKLAKEIYPEVFND